MLIFQGVRTFFVDFFPVLDNSQEGQIHVEASPTLECLGDPKMTWVKQEPYPSGQIIATSHDLAPNGGLVPEILLFQGNLGW